MDPRKFKPQQKRLRESSGEGEAVLHKKKIVLELYDTTQVLSPNGELEAMPSIGEDQLAEGTYWVIYAEGEMAEDTVYLLHEETRCVKRVQLGDDFMDLFVEGSMRYLIYINIWPLVRVTKNGLELLNVVQLSDLYFKDLDKWKIQTCAPFTFGRFVRQDQNEEDGGMANVADFRHFNKKMAMFGGGGTKDAPILPKLPRNGNVYIIGPVMKTDPESAYDEDLLVVTGKPPPLNSKRTETLIYQVHLLPLTDKLHGLLNHIPLTGGSSMLARFNWCSYYHFLCGDYVIKLLLIENSETKVTAVPLAETPFSDKTLKNHIFE